MGLDFIATTWDLPDLQNSYFVPPLQKSPNLAVRLRCVWSGKDDHIPLVSNQLHNTFRNCALTAQRLQQKGKKKKENLDLSIALVLYFLFSSGDSLFFPTTASEARNVLAEPHSVIICHEQECFICWCFNSFAYNSFGQAKQCSVVSLRGTCYLAGVRGMTATGLLPSNPILWNWLSPIRLCIPDVGLLTWQDDESIQSHPVIKQEYIKSCSKALLYSLSYIGTSLQLRAEVMLLQ